MFELTQEQQDIINTMETDPVVLVSAKAGCGKTATSLAVVNHFKPKKGFYTAYNKAIVLEAEEKFPSNMECVTKHAFALRTLKSAGYEFKKIEDFTYTCFEETLSYPQRYKIINAMGSFFLSDSTDMDEYLDKLLEHEGTADIAKKYVTKMILGEIPPTFDFLLKFLHLSLDQKTISVKYDLAILDECQDTTAVFFAIFQLIDADRKLIVGDPYQNIYGYMNTVNAFDLLPEDTPILNLTKSFRCSPVIADRVQKFGRLHLNVNFKYTGTESTFSNKTIAYIGRTNGSLLEAMLNLIPQGKTFVLTREVKEIFALPIALANVSAGREVFHKKYKYLEKEYKNYSLSGMRTFYTYLMKHVDDEELHSSIKFMLKLSKDNINIWDFKKKAEAATVVTGDTYIVTAHSFKGREVDTVYILDSLNESVMKIINKGGPEDQQDKEELNLGYVAITRARHTLLNCDYA